MQNNKAASSVSKYMIKSIFLILVALVTSCVVTNPPTVAQYLNQTRYMPKDFFLLETSNWHLRDPHSQRYELTDPALKSGLFERLPSDELKPTLSEYYQNLQKWHVWKSSFFTGSARILGVITKNTRYKITHVITGYDNYLEKIIIESGPFTGFKVENYSNTKLLPGYISNPY